MNQSLQSTFLALLLLLLGTNWASAEDLTVKVAGDRTAVINAVDTSVSPDMSGTVKGAANIKEGKSGLRADLVLKNAPELQGVQGDFFAQMTGQTIEFVGYVDGTLPPQPSGPKMVDVDVNTVTEGDQSAANFDIKLDLPANGEPVPKGSGKIAIKGDFKKLGTVGDFEFSGDPIKGSDFPFTKFELNISETAEGELVKTTISFSVTAAKGSDTANQLASLPTLAPMLEGQLKQSNIKYEGVDFPAPTTEGEHTMGKGAITLIDLRGTIKTYLPMLAMQFQGVPEAPKALEDMIGGRLDKLNFVLNVEPTAIKGSFVVDASSLDKFWNGYLTLLPAINEMSYQQQMAGAGEFRAILEPLMKLNTQQAVDATRLLVTSNMTMDSEASFTLDTTGTEAEKLVAFKTSGKMLASNYADFVEKAKAAGLPVAEKAVGKLTIDLKDQNKLTGDAYFYTDGNIVESYKKMLGKVAVEVKASESVQKAIADLKLEDASVKMTLQDGKMVILSRTTTSDLTELSGILLKQVAPQFSAAFTGASVDINVAEDGKGTKDAKIFFADFLPGKDAPAIKEALGLPSSATVTLDAPADQVTLVAVEQPEIAIDGKLADVQKSGEALLASSAADVAAGGDGGGGKNKWGLIAVGVLLLAGVGGFLAFGKKS